MELIIFILTTILAWLLSRLIVYQVKANRMEFPSLWEVPFIGNLQLLQLVLSKKPLEDHQKIIEAFPEYFKCWFLNFRFLCPHSPEAVRKILKSEECLSRPFFAKAMFSGFSGDEYHEWITKRRFMNQLFHVKSLKSITETIAKAADEFCMEFTKDIAGFSTFDIYPLIARWTIKVHCLFLIGIDDDNSINGVIEKLERLTSTRNTIAHSLILPQLARFFMPSKFSAMEVAKADLINFTKYLFTSQIASKSALKYSKNYSKTLGRDDYAEQIISLMDAGFETVALNITHALLFLAIHQNIQQQVYEEIIQNNEENLSEFDLLDRVIKETLRLAPPLPFLPRAVHKNFEIEPGKIVEKGTIILIPNYGVHRLKSVWGSEAEIFNPDNFSSENLKQKPANSAFQFSYGKRMCIGHRYAMIVMKILLIKLLKSHKFESDVNENVKFTAKCILSVDGSRLVRARVRKE